MKVFHQITMAAVVMATRCYGLQILSENIADSTFGFDPLLRLSDDEYQNLIDSEDGVVFVGKRMFVHRVGDIPDEEYAELKGHYYNLRVGAGSVDDRMRAFISKVGARLVDLKGIKRM